VGTAVNTGAAVPGCLGEAEPGDGSYQATADELRTLIGNAMKLSLDANYRQLGRWRSQARVRNLPRSVVTIG
jgi:hypothetical protein